MEKITFTPQETSVSQPNWGKGEPLNTILCCDDPRCFRWSLNCEPLKSLGPMRLIIAVVFSDGQAMKT